MVDYPHQTGQLPCLLGILEVPGWQAISHIDGADVPDAKSLLTTVGTGFRISPSNQGERVLNVAQNNVSVCRRGSPGPRNARKYPEFPLN